MKKLKEIQTQCPSTTVCIVSKGQPIDKIQPYVDNGCTIFGENRVKECIEKAMYFPNVDWHFIGHLQRNKAKQLLPYIQCVQSVESIALVQLLHSEAKKLNRTIDILVQVNIACEDTKYGLTTNETIDFIQKCLNYPSVCVKGLMIMGPNHATEEEINEVFQQGNHLFQQCRQLSPTIDTLSMGMSNDYTIAYNNGATMFRIGSCLFE